MTYLEIKLVQYYYIYIHTHTYEDAHLIKFNSRPKATKLYMLFQSRNKNVNKEV
jgi:hypothetical protein